jgi:asparagine synthase (glutamine-hydrolysing)
VLTGEGADELFAGYYRYIRQMLVEQIRDNDVLKSSFNIAQKTLFPHRFRNLGYPLSVRYHTQKIWTDDEIKLLIPDININKPENQILNTHQNKLLAMQLFDVHGYLAEQLLMKVDKATMANNLESRAPYLDTNIANFALSLPDSYKINIFQSKYVLRKLTQKYFPFWHTLRPKHGFSVPLGDWFETILKKDMAPIGTILTKRISGFNGAICVDLLDNKKKNSDKIFSLLVLAKWMDYHNLKI